MARQGLGGETNPDVPAADGVDVPVSGELVWKARAEDAEEKLEVCEAMITELQTELKAANDAVVLTQRRGDIERELTAARAVDLETACLLTEAAIGEMDEPDIAIAVRELKSRKPFLFSCGQHGQHNGGGVYGGGSAMSAAIGASGDGLNQLASSARSSGDRNELLRYLRARRGG